jgi:3-oxoacyl-[acyl-carrier protein] reductase
VTKVAMQRVLVTGSSRGLGKAVAQSLWKAGFSVTLHGRAPSDNLSKLREELSFAGEPAEVLCFDVADREASKAALAKSIEERGAFYGVVCNAGVTADGPFPGLSGNDWDSVLRTNLDGFYNILHPLVMPMIQLRSGGRIVVMSSVAGVIGNRGQVNYSASKAGLIGAAKALSKELAKRRISVNCVAPGFIESEMTEALPREEITKMIPMQRLGRPEEVGALVSFLFSEQAEYLTGQVLTISGGLA